MMEVVHCTLCNTPLYTDFPNPCCCSITKRFIPWNVFISLQDFVQDTLNLLPFIIEKKIDAIVGVARSGLIPATIIAEKLHLPLFSLDTKNIKLLELGGGSRFHKKADIHQPDTRFLIVDDTAASGQTLNFIHDACNKLFPHRNYSVLVVYADPKIINVEYVGYRYPVPHFLEWCLFNSQLMTKTIVVIDDVIVKRLGETYILKEYPTKHRIFKFLCMESNTIISNLLIRNNIHYYDLIINPIKSSYRIGLEPTEVEIQFVLNTLKNIKSYDLIIVYHKKLAERLRQVTNTTILCMETKSILAREPNGNTSNG